MATEEKMSVEQILKALHEKEVAEKGKCQEDVGFVSNSIEKGMFSPRDFLGGDLLHFAENIDPESRKMPSLGLAILKMVAVLHSLKTANR